MVGGRRSLARSAQQKWRRRRMPPTEASSSVKRQRRSSFKLPLTEGGMEEVECRSEVAEEREGENALAVAVAV